MKVKGYVNSLTIPTKNFKQKNSKELPDRSQKTPGFRGTGGRPNKSLQWLRRPILGSSYASLRNQMRIGSTWIHRIEFWIHKIQFSTTVDGSGIRRSPVEGTVDYPISINSMIGYQDEAVQGSKQMSLIFKTSMHLKIKKPGRIFQPNILMPYWSRERERDAFFFRWDFFSQTERPTNFKVSYPDNSPEKG